MNKIIFILLGISTIFLSCISVTNLHWTKDEFEIKEALIGNIVTIICDVKNISDEEVVLIEVWEYNDNKKHDFIEGFEIKINNNRIISNFMIEDIFKREELQCTI